MIAKVQHCIAMAGMMLCSISCYGQYTETSTRTLLQEQLKNTHTRQDWFVPMDKALRGLSPTQARWNDSTKNHSIAALVSHLVFWNEMNLRVFKGEEVPEFTEANEETFIAYENEDWDTLRLKLDSIQTEWEYLTKNATDTQLRQWRFEIVNMTSHTAYHTGQIVYIRKRNGWWN